MSDKFFNIQGKAIYNQAKKAQRKSAAPKPNPNSPEVNPQSIDFPESVSINEFPEHLFTPIGARGVDFIKLVEFAPNVGEVLMYEFTVPKGKLFFWRHYALFNDALTIDQSFFRVTIDGNPVLRFHGDPSNNFKLSLGATGDLGNDGLKEAAIVLLPGQTLKWFATNNDNVAVTMGVRTVGHIKNNSRAGTKSFTV